MNPKTNTRNPWFNEFWETQFNCTLTPKVNSKNLCTGDEKLELVQDSFIHLVVDSVFAMAHALDSIIRTKCQDYSPNELNKCNSIAPVKGDELLHAIRNVEFNSITGRRVKFLKDQEHKGDGIISFEVFQYQKSADHKYHYVKIAEWDSDKE